MNPLNIQRVTPRGAKILPVDGNHHVAILLPTGKTLAFSMYPHEDVSDRFTPETAGLSDALQREFHENDPACMYAGRSIIGVADLAKVVADAGSDKRLTDLGRREKIAGAGGSAVAVIAKQFADINARQRVVAQQENDLFYRPLLIQDSNVKAIMEDHEIRNHYRSLSSDDQLSWLRGINDGKHERMAAALLRSPIPLNERDSQIVTQVWRDTITAREPERAQALRVAQDNVEWAHHVVTACAPVVADLTKFSKFDLYRHSRDVGGVDVYGINSSDRIAFDHQLQAA